MKSGHFTGLDFLQHSSSEALAIKISINDGDGLTPVFTDKDGELTILCRDIESMKELRGAFLYAINVLDKHIED